MKKIYIQDYAAVTPFGVGVDPLWQSLIEGKSAIAPCSRFDVSNFDCRSASTLYLDTHGNAEKESLIWHLIEPIREQIQSWECDYIILATTKGEVDLLENHLHTTPDEEFPYELTPDSFLKKMIRYLNVPDGLLVSAACASSTTAIAMGAEKLLAGNAKKIAVIGIDIVSKFVFSGFSALHALSAANCAKPFDVSRDGLIPGEGCGALLLVKEEPGSSGKGSLGGWGNASDANHVTGPSRDGSGLYEAVSRAICMAGISSQDIGGVSAHGTGTLYNDAMEMNAFKKIFSDNIPVFSIKGALGHTMGASGVIETIVSLKTLHEGHVPPTAGLEKPDELSSGWVSNTKQKIESKKILKTNSGFGGINSSLILEG